MTFSISNALFQPPSVDKRMYNITHSPIFISLLEKLNPFIRNCHVEAVIKSHTTILDRNAECWHSTNIFTNRDSLRVETMNHVINKHQINHSIYISSKSKVLIVISSKSHLQKGHSD
uniref:Starch branching enzyme n=1 Tax=Rhizophora mucronata TaxID=61149 RepID=A0A2P2M6N6_RHIMU